MYNILITHHLQKSTQLRIDRSKHSKPHHFQNVTFIYTTKISN